VIHNIYVPEGVSVDFEMYDGTNIITFDSDDGASPSRLDVRWHATNTDRIRIQNTSGAAAFLAADGMVTK
jgi:hypothetical protein